MKIKAILPVFAVIAALAFVFGMSSFGNKQTPQDIKKPVLVQAWFECIDPLHPDDPDSYRYLDGQSPSCSGSEDVCAILADVQNNAVPDGDKRPVELTANGEGRSLQDLSIESSEFTMETANVKLEE